MTAPPPLTTTLDELRSLLTEIRADALVGQESTVRAGRGLDLLDLMAAQPPPPAEALQELRALVEGIERAEPQLRTGDDVAWAIFMGGMGPVGEARRYLAATEEGTP